MIIVIMTVYEGDGTAAWSGAIYSCVKVVVVEEVLLCHDLIYLAQPQTIGPLQCVGLFTMCLAEIVSLSRTSKSSTRRVTQVNLPQWYLSSPSYLSHYNYYQCKHVVLHI